ncbi:MAG: inositol monophosphatase family protein [Proteobacteria bacterium]|nr:inositol monophosphatase family protein [Pseudomonadota bacterium]
MNAQNISAEYLKELVKVANNAALKAGNYLMDNKNLDKEIYLEKGRDIKLEIDRNSEKIIYEELKGTKISFLGEEFGLKKKSEDGLLWVVDPLDGTSNYFRGIDQCCVSIALMQNESSLLGVVYNFNSNDIYYASKGNGAYLNDIKIKVSSISDKSLASLTTGFPASEKTKNTLDFLGDLSKWKKIRMFGSAALSCAYVASGKCDVYLEKGIYLWDIAAGICLVQEAGGSVKKELLQNDQYSIEISNGIL